MKDIFNNIKIHKKYFLIGFLVLLVVLYFILGRSKNGTELYVVGNADIMQSVILSGKVTTSDKADLGFASTGRLGGIFVKNNQNVHQGQILAQLEIGDLLADLKIKQLNSKTSSVALEDAKEEVEKIKIREKTKVENAYRTLLTEGLELTPNSNDYDVELPVIGGIYNGAEGEYKVRIKNDNSDLMLLTFNLEKTEEIIDEEGSTPLGTKGLYISFPDSDIFSYQDTVWFLDIPNKTSSSYLSNYNAYNEAKNESVLAIKNAEFEYQKLLTEDDNGASVAQAEVQKINAEIRKNTIYAPFDGRVTNIEKELGENVSVGERLISVLGEEKLEVVLQVSELDVSRLVPGASIKISVDAFPEEEFYGILKTVNSRETEVDGVPVYEAFVELKSNEKIKTGMSANGMVVLANKSNVLAIPSYLIKKINNSNFVDLISENGSTEETEITLGLVGTDSMVEIISGLNLGDKILSSSEKK